MSSPVEQTAFLKIGTVESVSPDEIKVILQFDAPQTMALNTGAPHGFPRINGYVLIPNETGALVGMIVWLGIERSPYPKSSQLREQGLLELPIPVRKLIVIPMGTLIQRRSKGSDGRIHCLERGVSLFPTVGDTVLLPTKEQLRNIVEAAEPESRRVFIGNTPLASNARVTVDPNKLFGRHLAVLGNTGSGKSCTVAGLIRWSLEAAEEVRAKEGKDNEGNTENAQKVNARFIILDPNGEYSTAFSDFIAAGKAKVFRLPPSGVGAEDLVVPAWMWNSQEWCAFTEASSKVQKPILIRALQELRTTSAYDLDRSGEITLAAFLRSMYRALRKSQQDDITTYTQYPGTQNLGQMLQSSLESLEHLKDGHRQYGDAIENTIRVLKDVLQRRAKNVRGFYPEFSLPDFAALTEAVEAALQLLPKSDSDFKCGEDRPVPFDVDMLPDVVAQIALEQGQIHNVDTLTLRIRALLSNERLRPAIRPATECNLEDWLEKVVGGDLTSDGSISILDLSLISSDVLHTIISVIARTVFEAIQRYRRATTVELPTVLVLEEAHAFVKRGSETEDENATPSQMCRQTFERIAREGRKYGLGLLLSSQRPSELSPTVLAQCNSFILHRIVNDRDQELVGKLVPDNLGGLLKELPSLPSRQAILLGWASAIPTLMEVRELSEQQRPHSADPRFWEVWTGEDERKIDWKGIVDEWTEGRSTRFSEDKPIPQTLDEIDQDELNF